MTYGLHADHVDASGAYAQKFEVVKHLLETGALIEIPEEFRDTIHAESVPVITTSQTIVGNEFDMTNGHADHVDETGRYRQAYEAKYGVQTVQETAGNSWKGFLQKIIAEEKSKLKI